MLTGNGGGGGEAGGRKPTLSYISRRAWLAIGSRLSLNPILATASSPTPVQVNPIRTYCLVLCATFDATRNKAAQLRTLAAMGTREGCPDQPVPATPGEDATDAPGSGGQHSKAARWECTAGRGASEKCMTRSRHALPARIHAVSGIAISKLGVGGGSSRCGSRWGSLRG